MALSKVWRLAAAATLATTAAGGFAATPDKPSAPDQTLEAQIWRVDGGELRLRFNDSFLDLFGMKAELTAGVRDTQYETFAVFPVLPSEGIEFNAPDGGFDRFVGGSLHLHGGFELKLADGSRIDLRNADLRPSADNPMRLELVGADGQVFVYVNHLMFKFVDDYRTFHVRSADLRASAALAKRVGAAELADAYIGELRMDLGVRERSREFAAQIKGALPPKFHGTAHPDGGIYEADVLMETYGMAFSRCRRSDGITNGCDGAGEDDGEVVFTPSATLRNGNTDRTADIPWYEKFTGHTNPYGYPYPNADQHPYLIWNLYRVVDDQLEQIGASGVKHAFLTINVGCAPGGNQFGGHILGRNCSDVYGTGNNDNVGDLGPRHELLPASGVWGRCGSIFDTDCNGQADALFPSCSSGPPAGPSCYSQRMVVRESQLLTSGASFWSEAWYIVQDDTNIYNTIGNRTLSPAHSGSVWLPVVWNDNTRQGPFTIGPVINAWVDPVAQPDRNIELSGEHGRVRVAVKVKTLPACPEGSGLTGTCYRYDYAVANFDYAVAETGDTTLPNLRVTDGKGFDRVRFDLLPHTEVAVEAGAHFADIDIDAANDWSVDIGTARIEWTAPETGNELNWGQLFRFSFVSDGEPESCYPISIALQPANGHLGASTLSGRIVGPKSSVWILRSGFENC